MTVLTLLRQLQAAIQREDWPLVTKLETKIDAAVEHSSKPPKPARRPQPLGARDVDVRHRGSRVYGAPKRPRYGKTQQTLKAEAMERAKLRATAAVPHDASRVVGRDSK